MKHDILFQCQFIWSNKVLGKEVNRVKIYKSIYFVYLAAAYNFIATADPSTKNSCY